MHQDILIQVQSRPNTPVAILPNPLKSMPCPKTTAKPKVKVKIKIQGQDKIFCPRIQFVQLCSNWQGLSASKK